MKFVKNLFSSKKTSVNSQRQSAGAKTTTGAAKTTLSDSKPLSPDDIVAIALGQKTSSIPGDQIKKAVATLPYNEQLKKLALTSNKYTTAAQKNIASHLDEGRLSAGIFGSEFPEVNDRLSISSYCKKSQVCETLISEFDDEHTLFELCGATTNIELRGKLIQAINSEDSLKKIEKALKTNDKKNFKLAKQKLDQIKSVEDAKKALESKKNRLELDITAHSVRTFNQDYEFKLDSLTRKFNELSAQYDETIRDSIIQKLDICKSIIQEAEHAHAKKTENSSANAPQGDSEPKHDNTAQLVNLISQLFEASVLIKNTTNDIKIALNDFEVRDSENTRELVNQKEAAENFLYRIENDDEFSENLGVAYDDNSILTQDALRSIEQSTRAFYQSKLSKETFLKSSLGKSLSTSRDKINESENNAREEFRHISGLIRKAQAALGDGNLKRAQGIRFSIEEKLEGKQAIPSHIDRNWQELLSGIENLGDWQTYAISPKLDTLVEKMKALAEQPQSAELQATQINKLQQEWKSITKGSGKKHQALWESFKSYADRAYEVCKAHYDELDTIRSENTERRQALIQQLNDYTKSYDWENAAWPQVEKVLSAAKSEWQQYSPSLRAQQKQQQTAFNTQIDFINERLNNWYQSNKAAKERLINSLAPLVDSEDIGHAISVAIDHQKQWKQIGHCRRKDNEALWQAFRGHCDAIFAKRDAQRNAEKAETNKKIEGAEAIISKLQDIEALADSALPNSRETVNELKEEFDQFEGLPKSVHQALAKKLHKSISNIEARKSEAQKNAKRGVWQKLFALKEQSFDVDVSDESAKTAFLQMLEDEATTHNQYFQRAFKALQKSLTTEWIENPDTYYRQLCIVSEIQHDLDSPEEDKALRMQYQVEQLTKHFGQQSTQPSELAEQWLAGPNEAFGNYTALTKRFLEHSPLV